MRFGLNTLTIALMPIAIVINITLGQTASFLSLPFSLDSIGTILVGVLAGPIVGALTGLLTHLLWGLIFANNAIFWSIPVAMLIGILAGLLGARTWLRKSRTTIAAGIVTGILAGTTGALIIAFLPDGTTDSTDALTTFYLGLTNYLPLASWLQGITIEPIEQLIGYLLIFIALKRLPRHLLVRFPQGKATAPAKRVPLIGRID